MTDYYAEIAEAIQEGDRDRVTSLAEEALAGGNTAVEILEKGMVPGIEALGERFKTGELFLPEILISARAMKEGMEVLAPHFPKEGVDKRGTVVLGTVEGDMHDIGKNLVRMMLDCGGFRVIDLGVDVTAEAFVNAALDYEADIVAMSALLTTTMTNMPKVVDALRQTSLRNKVKVMIGGACVTRSYADEIGAEGFAEDCTDAIDEAKRLIGM